MNTDKNETQMVETEQAPKLTAEQNWALRMADGRHRELTARVEEVAVGTAKTAVAVEGIDTKVNAILEAVAPEAPKGWLDSMVFSANEAADKVMFYARPVLLLVATGFAVNSGVRTVQGIRQRRAEAKAAASLPTATPSAS